MSDMSIGQHGCVTSLGQPDAMEKRLKEFGLIEGTHTECVMRSSHGDMAAFMIRGACIALRKNDSERITCICDSDSEFYPNHNVSDSLCTLPTSYAYYTV